MRDLTDEEIELDLAWRATFGEPLPMLGAPDIVRAILADQSVPSESGPP